MSLRTTTETRPYVHYGDVPDAERQRVRRALETYCTQDTIGMTWILDELQRLVAG